MRLKTLVYQSHAARVPVWILRCTASVRAWAARQDYAYRLLGDELFAGIPNAVSNKAQSMLPLADIGRLMWAERLLREWDCVIWIDSDVLVFEPAGFVFDTTASAAVCREVLVDRGKAHEALSVRIAQNPTVLLFRRGAPLLGKWLSAARREAERMKGFADAEFGRGMLRKITAGRKLPEITTVGHFNAAILKEIYGEPGEAIDLMMRAAGGRFAAANLCGHHAMPNAVYERITARLEATEGGVVNDRLAGRADPTAKNPQGSLAR